MSSGFVGIVNRFGAHPQDYPIGVALTRLGLSWCPLELSSLLIGLKDDPSGDLEDHASSVFVRSLSEVTIISDLNLDGILWRVSENDLETCLPLLHAFEADGLKVVNPLLSLVLCADKWATYLRLLACDVPTVPTVFLLPGAPVPVLDGHGAHDPVVVKPNNGAGGRGVRLAFPHEIADPMRSMLVQPVVATASDHRRVLVCAGRAVAAMRRHPTAGSFANNLFAGGVAEPVPLGSEASIAVAAAAATGSVVVGVDLAPVANSWQVFDVNASPGIFGHTDCDAPAAVAAAAAEFFGLA